VRLRTQHRGEQRVPAAQSVLRRALLLDRLGLLAGAVAIDQRVPQLPLCAGELEAVPLEGGLARAPFAQLLPLADEARDQRRELLSGRRRTTPPETRGPQVPQ